MSDIDAQLHKIKNGLAGTNPNDFVIKTQLDAVIATSSTISRITDKATMVALNVTDTTLVFVSTYRDYFRLDKVTTRTAVPDQVIQSTVNAAWWWVRLCIADPSWYAVTDWYIDPAGTFSPVGNDEALGDATHPIKSIAEWRRRVRGAIYTGTGPVIHALSSSSVTDDSLFYGYSTPDLTTYVRLVGIPVAIGVSGIISSYVAYSGNTRGQFTDASIPTSWTVSNAISNASGSRWIRRTGIGIRHYSQLIKDLGAKSVQFGIAVDWDETDVVTTRTIETNFVNGDTYEVVSLPTWPSPSTSGQANLLLQNLDIVKGGGTFPDGFNTGQLRFRLCGFPQNTSIVGRGAILYSCVICMASTNGLVIQATLFAPLNCSLCNTGIIQYNAGSYSLTSPLVVVGSELRFWHGTEIGSFESTIRSFDCTVPLINVRHNSTCKNVGTIVGSGNTGKLVNCDSGGIFYGASAITATTSDVLPYQVNGVAYAAPVVDGGSGDGIYN